MPPASPGPPDCGLFDGDGPSTRTLFQENKKELSAALSVIFGVLACLGLFFAVDPKDLVEARNWAGQRWRQSFCTVEDFGVSYRGSCETGVTLMMTDYNDFAECLGPRRSTSDPREVREEWATSPAGLCAARGDAAYAASSAGGDLTGRRLTEGYHERLTCHNSYLPWALLRLENGSSAGGGAAHARGTLGGGTRCAYQFGAVRPSITGDWPGVLRSLAHLKRARGVPGGVVCWALEAEDCVLAFHDESGLLRAERGERDLIRVHTTVCGTLALLLGLLAAHWQCQDQGFWPSPRGGRHVALPTSEPPLGPLLSERVHQVMSVAAQRLTEATPPGSGASTLRVSGADGDQRTVGVVLSNGKQTTVSQNIASDFIEVVR